MQALIKEFKPSMYHTELKEWVQGGLSKTPKCCVEFMENVGLFLCDKKVPTDFPGYNALTTSQIRNIFTEIRRIEAKTKKGQWDKSMDISATSTSTTPYTEFVLLRPKMAYSAAKVLTKNRTSRIKDFREIFDVAHDAVTSDSLASFQNFCRIMEGILAYHKVYGGRD